MPYLHKKIKVRDLVSVFNLPEDTIQTVEFPEFYWNETLNKIYNANKDAPGCKVKRVETKEVIVYSDCDLVKLIPDNHYAIFVGTKRSILYLESDLNGMTFRVVFIKK